MASLNIFHFHLMSIFDVESMIRNGGLLVVFLFVFGTTGLFFCFFIPVGAFLFTAGILAGTGRLGYDIYTVCSLLVLASGMGNIAGYWFGWKAGPLLYRREDSRFFKKRHLTTADSFYKKYGWMALTLGLYLPIVRTFAPIVAGIIRLNFRRFMILTLLGSSLWIVSFVLAGYFIGKLPVLKQYLNYIVFGFVLAVTIPLIIWVGVEFRKMRKANEKKARS